MSLFIHRENQTLLWEMLHKSPYWTMFETNMGGNTQLWFRNIISMFYDRRWETQPDLQMSVAELKQLNREVILFCIQDIKRCLGVEISPMNTNNTVVSQPDAVASANTVFDINSRLAMYDRPPEGGGGILTPQETVFPSNGGDTNTIANAKAKANTEMKVPTYAQLQSEFSMSEQKEVIAKRAAAQFETFQRQYNDTFTAPKPDAIDFTTRLNEPKIKNMEELMEQQMKYREMEDKMYTPQLGAGGMRNAVTASSMQ
jgi:hypothetical protein